MIPQARSPRRLVATNLSRLHRLLLPAVICFFLIGAGGHRVSGAMPKDVLPMVTRETGEAQKQVWMAPGLPFESVAGYVTRVRREAEGGDATARATLGLMCQMARGANRDYAKAAEWYRQAAAQGHAGAENNLGQLYDDGLGVPRDPQKAHELYLRAAGRGLAQAEFNVGFNYAVGRAVEQDWGAAARWYEKAAAKGFIAALNNLGNIYLKGRGTPRDLGRAEKLLRRAAAADSAVASFGVAVTLLVKGDTKESLRWYRRAAELGYPPAWHVYADELLVGHEGLPRDVPEALRWARRAAESGLAPGQSTAALILLDHVPKTESTAREAFKWAKASADQNYPRGQAMLGLCYHRGAGVEKSRATAAEWYRKAAEQGEPDAASNLAALLSVGADVERNLAEAARWYRVAAEQGHFNSQYRLALFLRDGTGVEANPAEALKWLRLAAAQKPDDPDVKSALAEAERMLSRSTAEIAESAFRIGLGFCRQGEKGKKTWGKAAEHLQRSIDAGGDQARGLLAGLYRRGQGVPRDDAKADALIAPVEAATDPRLLCSLGTSYLENGLVPEKYAARAADFFRRSAGQGFVPAHNFLGFLHMSSIEQRDLVEAVKWLTLAAKGRDTRAPVNLKRVRTMMSAEDFAEGERRAASFLPVRMIAGK